VSVIDLHINEEIEQIPVPGVLTDIVLSQDGGYAYITDLSEDTISVVDLVSYRLVSTIPAGDRPTDIAISTRTNHIYVANQFSNNITIIDLNLQKQSGTIDVDNEPIAIQLSNDGKFAYTVHNRSDQISVIDLETQQKTDSIPVGISPKDIVISDDGKYAYVIYGTLTNNGISIIDLQTKQIVNNITTFSDEPLAIAIPNRNTRILSQTATDYSVLDYDLDSKTYTRIYPGGTEVHFNQNGMHDYTLKSDGQKTAYSYNADGTVATMGVTPPTEEAPRWVWIFNYSGGRLSSISDPVGRVANFTINNNNDLVEVTTPDQATQRFAYDNRHLLTEHTKQNNQTTTYAYDKYARITSVTEPPRPIYNQTTETAETKQETQIFTPSDTGYAPG